MTNRPTELDLSLDAIDEAFSDMVKQMCRDVGTYGVAPIVTQQDAIAQGRKVYIEARRTRAASIAIVTAALAD